MSRTDVTPAQRNWQLWRIVSGPQARSLLVMLGLVTLVAVLASAQEAALHRSSFLTGYLLAFCVLFLSAYHWRKRVSWLPLGSSRAWMQAHLAVGWTSIGFFALHAGWPTGGGLERLLAVIYLGTAASGIVGLVMTRSLPKRLAALDTEVIFEQIPAQRREVAIRVERRILESAEESDVLARWYLGEPQGFFEGPRDWAYLLAPSGRQRRRLQQQLAELDRYLSDDQRRLRQELSQCVQQRDDLDYQFVLQGRLKLWLFAHVSLTYSLLILGGLHVVVAHAFQGAAG